MCLIGPMPARNAVAKEKTCTFRISKNILHREIPNRSGEKLITTAKTDLPEVCFQEGPPVSAHLKLENGKSVSNRRKKAEEERARKAVALERNNNSKRLKDR